tara:strand:- start:409 stop:768 length:360 start_codon:yes stop_codon:yes gene_type:complete
MAQFASSFGSKERKVKRAGAARTYTHRSPIRWACFETMPVSDNAGTMVHIMVDGDTYAVLTTQGNRMQGEPTLFNGKNASQEANACARVLLATLRSANKPQVATVSSMIDMLNDCTLGN